MEGSTQLSKAICERVADDVDLIRDGAVTNDKVRLHPPHAHADSTQLPPDECHRSPLSRGPLVAALVGRAHPCAIDGNVVGRGVSRREAPYWGVVLA